MPTASGEGKTTTSVGLGDGMNRLEKSVAICLREPSLESDDDYLFIAEYTATGL